MTVDAVYNHENFRSNHLHFLYLISYLLVIAVLASRENNQQGM